MSKEHDNDRNKPQEALVVLSKTEIKIEIDSRDLIHEIRDAKEFLFKWVTILFCVLYFSFMLMAIIILNYLRT